MRQRKSPLVRRACGWMILLLGALRCEFRSFVDAFPFALNHLDAKFFGKVGVLSANHHFDLFFQNLVFHLVHLLASGLFRSYVYSINQIFGFVNRQNGRVLKLVEAG